MLTSLGRTRPPGACRTCDTGLREYAVNATEMTLSKRGYCWGKKIRKTKNTSEEVFMKKSKLSKWVKHGKCVGKLRQKWIQNFTPKMTIEMPFGRTRCKCEDNLYICTYNLIEYWHVL